MEGSGAEESASSSGHAPIDDGAFDFSSYSLEQLEQLIFSFDRANQPKNFSRLLDTLQARRTSAATQGARRPAACFTSRSGVMGWLQALTARSPFYGEGSVSLESGRLTLDGRRTAWFGRSLETRLGFDLVEIQDLKCSSDSVEFSVRRPLLPSWRIHYHGDTPAIASLSAALQLAFSTQQAAPATQLAAFNQLLSRRTGRPFIIFILLAVNALAYLLMAASQLSLAPFPQTMLLAWGASHAPLSLGPQWPRLIVAAFLHVSLAHVALNMLALWYVGRLTERLFGHAALLAIYMSCALVSSLASCVWDPSLTMVGASGAIFGVYGALLAFLVRRRLEIPSRVLNPLWISALVFCLFNLTSGALSPAIDNAAHVGGLLCGLVMGFIWSRPLDLTSRDFSPAHALIASIAFASATSLFFGLEIAHIGSFAATPERVVRMYADYGKGEAINLNLWDQLTEQWKRGEISSADVAGRFKHEILPFWTTQAGKLKKASEADGPTDKATALLARFAETRRAMAELVIKDAESGQDDSARLQKAGQEVTAAQAALEWLALRFLMDARSRALSGSPLIMQIRYLRANTRCVRSPYSVAVAATDNPRDAPAIRSAAACDAQRLFMTGKYVELQDRLDASLKRKHDLPDGSSTYEALTGGLDSLFAYGDRRAFIADVLLRTASWRKVAPNVTWSNIVEAMALGDWAWSVRGSGPADSVSAQNMALFEYRNLMAAAALGDIASQASGNPEWYSQSLRVSLERGMSKSELSDLYDRGNFFDTNSDHLYRNMLRALMPRWGGSFSKVKQFVEREGHLVGMRDANGRYAELYTAYARLEGDDTDLFDEAEADWRRMRRGFRDLIKAHPNSDLLLNEFAEMACRAGDHAAYDELRPQLTNHASATAWTVKFSRKACDDGSAMPSESASTKLETPIEHVVSLDGVKLGMSRAELRQAKGDPAEQTADEWVYHRGTQRDGTITVFFAGGPEGVVEHILYDGGEESAPKDMPYLGGMSSVQLLQQLGTQSSGQLVLSGKMPFTFPDGVYAETVDEKVTRYGIYTVH